MDYGRHYEQYANFKKDQAQLSGLIEDASQVIEKLNMERFKDSLAKLDETIQNDSFKVQIVGTFKNGKSTFINSILGEEIMPAYALPCTAIVNEIKWAAEKKAIVHFRNPLPESLPSGIPQRALEHMKRYDMQNIPPLEVPYNELQQYAVISLDNGQNEFDYQSPYEKIEVFWPLELLKNGVEIIDSPGLNESLTRTEVTMNYIAKADAVLFVLDATRILSADEMRVIDTTIKKYGFRDPFIVVNKFDAIRKTEKEAMREFIHEKLGSYTDKDFFFVSALNALDGKLDGDDALLASSGMPEFEKALANFLVKEKGRAKLSRPIRELKRIVGEETLFKAIPMQKNALEYSVDEMNAKYESAKPMLELLKKKKQTLFDGLLERIEASRHVFSAAAAKNMLRLKESIPQWITQYTPQTKTGMIPTKQQLTTIAGEIIKFLGEQLESDQLDWRNMTLQPLVTDEVNKILEPAKRDMQEIFDGVDGIVSDISDGTVESIHTNVWQRACDLTGDISIMESLISQDGNMADSPKPLSFVAPIAITALVGLLSAFAPLLTAIGICVFDKVRDENGAVRKVKESISNSAAERASQIAMTFPAEFADDLVQKLNEMARTVTDGIDVEINETENRIQSALKELEKGRENVDLRKEALAGCEEQIKQIISKLDDLSFSLSA